MLTQCFPSVCEKASQATEVKTSALVSRRSWVRIPPESPVKFFDRHTESTEYTVLYTRRRRAKLNQLIINESLIIIEK